MTKIDWDKGFIGIDGKEYDRKAIEAYFIDTLKVKDHIKPRLDALIAVFLNNAKKKTCNLKHSDWEIKLPKEYWEFFARLTEILIKNLPKLILGRPTAIKGFASVVDLQMETFKDKIRKNKNIKIKKSKKGIVWKNQDDKTPNHIVSYFFNQIEKKFNYEHFRKNGLNQLAGMLNVKTCPYCNQIPTLVTLDKSKRSKSFILPESDAFLQFDHFLPKSKYPYLSMSLYNLIPSCPICNLKKRDSYVSLKYHPYENDVNQHVKFRIKNADVIFNPIKHTTDFLDVEIDTDGDTTLRKFYENIALPERYARYLEEVQDINISVFLSNYYDKQYDEIVLFFKHSLSGNEEATAALERHIKGFHNKPEDIHKRPLNKFSQDIYEQLTKLEHHK